MHSGKLFHKTSFVYIKAGRARPFHDRGSVPWLEIRSIQIFPGKNKVRQILCKVGVPLILNLAGGIHRSSKAEAKRETKGERVIHIYTYREGISGQVGLSIIELFLVD